MVLHFRGFVRTTQTIPGSAPAEKMSLWLHNRKNFINTDKLHAIVIVYENRETAFVIIYNGKSLPTLTNWICDYTTSKVREHRETEFVIIQRQKFINTDQLCNRRYRPTRFFNVIAYAYKTTGPTERAAPAGPRRSRQFLAGLTHRLTWTL